MIILFNEYETNFNSNGVCVLDNVLYSKPQIIEELNGDYTLELYVAIAGNDKHNLIQKDMIILADDNYFRIQERKKNFNSVYVYCKQIFWDLDDNLLEDVRPTNENGTTALNDILSNTQYEHNFIGYSDLANTATADYVRMSPVSAIMSGTSSSSSSATSAGSSDNAFLSLWGGEIQLEKFKISILQRRGADRGVVISYGKNLTGIEEDLNTNDTKTRIMPIGQDENNVPILLPEKYIDSQYINSYPHPKIGTLDVSEAKVDSDNGITLNDVYTLLRNAVAKQYAAGIDLPTFNYTVNFIDLANTEEYKNYAVLERVYLGDTVTIKHKKLNMDLKARVVKTTKEYNISKQIWEYTEIELGQANQSLTQQSNTQISEIHDTINTKATALQQAILYATNLITGNKGGYVILHKDANGKPYEILIMDTQDTNTAQKVWRWNEAGLGYSSTGYNGPYGLAITADGSIVADFITTGVLNADLIKTGTISSADGSFKINLANGHFTTFSNGKKSFDIVNQTATWYDFEDTESITGQISSNRVLDSNGNPTGLPVFSLQVPHGVILDLSSIESDAKHPVLEIDNYATDSNKQSINIYKELNIHSNVNVNGSPGYTGSMFMTDGGTVYHAYVQNGIITSFS